MEWTGFSDSTYLNGQLEEFRQIRHNEQIHGHQIVLALGGALITIGSVVEGMDATWRAHQLSWTTSNPSSVDDVFLVTVFLLGVLLLSSGVVVVSLNPSGDFDMNAGVAERRTMRYSICLVAAWRSLCLGVAPPHFCVIGALAAAGGLSISRTRVRKRLSFERRSGKPPAWSCKNLCPKQPYFTSLLVAILVTWMFGSLATYLHILFFAEDRFAIPAYQWLIWTACHLVIVVLWLGRCCFRLRRQRFANSLDSWIPTESLYVASYEYLCLMGVLTTSNGVLCCFDADLGPVGARQILTGLAYIAPCLVFLLLKRKAPIVPLIMSPMPTAARRERDGAFLAAMMDFPIVRLGKPWWIHRAAGEKDHTFPKDDHRHSWYPGVIVKVEDDKFWVQVVGQDDLVEHKLPNQQSSSKDLLELARTNLRCVDWENLSPGVFNSELDGELGGVAGAGKDSEAKLTGTITRAQTRPVPEGEKIDFFVSHSWHDDGRLKYAQLEKIAKQFIEEKWRPPTFWLDHLCIDQASITDGLKALPVNVYACNKVLALCGDTYLQRLWCAWELCTTMAFLDDLEHVMDHIIILPVLPGDTGERDVLERFTTFDIQSTCCYDPNEQSRVFAVVRTIGIGHFNHMVQQLGRTQLAAYDGGACKPWLMIASPTTGSSHDVDPTHAQVTLEENESADKPNDPQYWAVPDDEELLQDLPPSICRDGLVSALHIGPCGHT